MKIFSSDVAVGVFLVRLHSSFTFKTESDSGSFELVGNFIANSRFDSLWRNDKKPVWITRMSAQVQVGSGSIQSRCCSRHGLEFGRSMAVTFPPEFFEKFTVLLLLSFVLLEQDVLRRLARRHRVRPLDRSPICDLATKSVLNEVVLKFNRFFVNFINSSKLCQPQLFAGFSYFMRI